MLARLALGVVALLVLLRAGLPSILESVAESRGEAALGTPLSLGDVDLSLLSGEVSVRAVAFPALEFASLDGARLDLDYAGLLGGEIAVTALDLERLVVRLEQQDDGSVRLLGFELPAAEADEPDASVDEEAPPVVRLDRLLASSAEVTLVDSAGDELLGFELDGLEIEGLRVADGDVEIAQITIGEPSLALSWPTAREAAVQEPSVPVAPESPPAKARGKPPDNASQIDATGGGADSLAGPAAEADEDSEALGLRIGRVVLEKGSVRVAGEAEAFQLGLDVEVESFDLAPDSRSTTKARLTAADGVLEISGRVTPTPLALDMELEWDGIDLAKLLLALPIGDTRLASGATSGDLAVGFANDAVSLSGKLSLEGLDVAVEQSDLDAKVVAEEVGFEIEHATLELEREAALTGNLALVGLDIAVVQPDLDAKAKASKIRVEIGSATIGLAEQADAPEIALALLRVDTPAIELVRTPRTDASEPSAAVESGETTGGPNLELAKLEIRGGSVVFDDRAGGRAVRTALSEVSLDAKALDLRAQSAADVALNALFDSGGRLGAQGNVRRSRGEIELHLEEVDLLPFAPYAADGGLELAGGRLSLDVDATLGDARTSLENQIVLDELDLSGEGKGFVKALRLPMPLPLAIALLRDPKGRISLSAPIEVERGASDIDLIPVVQSALRQALIGALSTPLKAAGLLLPGMSGGSSQGVGGVAFGAGSAELTPAAQTRVSELAALLKQRPRVKLELLGSAGDGDRGSVADDAALLELARARANAVLDALVAQHEVERERLELAEPTLGLSRVAFELAL